MNSMVTESGFHAWIWTFYRKLSNLSWMKYWFDFIFGLMLSGIIKFIIWLTGILNCNNCTAKITSGNGITGPVAMIFPSSVRYNSIFTECKWFMEACCLMECRPPSTTFSRHLLLLACPTFLKVRNGKFNWSGKLCQVRGIDREPAGISLARKLTNFNMHDIVAYSTLINEMLICRVFVGGCGHQDQIKNLKFWARLAQKLTT